MGFGTLEQLIAKGTPSPITSALQGFQSGAQMIPSIQLAKLAPLLRQAQIAQAQAQVPYLGAETTLKQTQAKYLPFEDLIKLGNLQQSQTRFGAPYQAARMLQALPKAQSAQVVATNPMQYLSLYQNLLNQGLNSGQTQTNTALNQLAAKLYGNQAVTPTTTTPSIPSVNQLANASPQQQAQNNQIVKQQLLNTGTYTPEQAEHITNLMNLAASQALVQGKTKERAQNAATLDNWITKNRDEYSRRINNAFQYAGAYGRGKRYLQSWLNANPDALSDYDWFTTTFKNFLNTNISLQEKVGSTDYQTRDIKGMIDDTNNLLTNPERAKKSFNKLMSTLHQVSQQIYNTAEPFNYKGIYKKAYDIKDWDGDYLNTSQPLTTQTSAQQITGKIRVISPDGRRGSIPSEDLQEALKQGYKRIS